MTYTLVAQIEQCCQQIFVVSIKYFREINYLNLYIIQQSSFVESSFDVISCDKIVAVKIHITMKYTKLIYKVENPVSHRACLSRIADNDSQRLIV